MSEGTQDTSTGEPETSDEASTTGVDLSECIANQFGFPDGPPMPGAELTLQFTGQAFANIGFEVDGSITQNVDSTGGGPIVYTGTISGADIPPNSATIRFLSDIGDPLPGGVEVASCVANY